MTPTEIAWLAGIVEGEGTILVRGRTGVSVKVAMTDEDVVRRLHEVTGVGLLGGPFWSNNSTKPVWRWDLHRGEDVARILLAIYPLMGVRRGARIAEAADRLASRFLRHKASPATMASSSV